MKAKILVYIIIAAIAAPTCFAAKRRVAAKPKFTTEELTEQARQALIDYDVETAKEKIAALRTDKKADPEIVGDLGRRIERMDEMIQRVQDIAVIDSINVGRHEFFRHYRLSTAAGRLVGTEELMPGRQYADETVAFIPEDGSAMIWGTADGLVESRRLTDGTWDTPQPLGDNVNAGGTANYPFLLSDGATLYFATDGDDSLGGLDLYITQRQRDGFALPQNMGMPYNSPFNDLMLTVGEETGAGWFATDRNQRTDSVTIYIFEPAETRVNINIDDPDLTDRARIATLTAPLTAGQSAILKRISEIDNSNNFGDADNTPDFEFALPDGRILTRWEDFRSSTARRLMENYVDAQAEAQTEADALEKLRQRFKPGDKALSRQILTLEKKVAASQQSLKKLANQVIQAETRK